MARKITRKGIIRKLDRLVSQLVIARDKKCIVCGTTQNLTCGHLFSRVAYSTRWDLNNCYAQCLGCNFRHENDPYPMTQAVRKIWMDKCKFTLGVGVEADILLSNLHYKYVHPVKYKTYELEELYHELAKEETELK